MPVRDLSIKSGVSVEKTPVLNQDSLSSSQLIRFMNGLPQKMGGWQSVSSAPLIGTCRGLLGWGDLQGNTWLAAGTNEKLYVLENTSPANPAAPFDITPIFNTTNNAPNITSTASSSTFYVVDASSNPSLDQWVIFNCHVSIGGVVLFGQYQVSSLGSNVGEYYITGPTAASSSSSPTLPVYQTTSGSGTVQVTLPNHGLSTGSVWTQVIPVTVGGMTISAGQYPVTVINSSTFTIQVTEVASSTASATENNGDLQIQYQYPIGFAVNTSLTGYGMGNYGQGPWGQSGAAVITSNLRQWSLTHFGQDLIANFPGGPIFYWSPSSPDQPAAVLPNAPTQTSIVFMMNQVEILVACGTPLNGTFQPTLISWSDAGNMQSWTPTAYNQAGNFQLPNGSKIVSALAFGLGALIWTDEGLWSMTYQGLPFVFGFNQIGVGCEAISMRSTAPVPGELVVWPNLRGFYSYNGYYVTPMACPVWDFFFYQVDYNQLDQIFAAVNTLFNEVAWYFPVAGTNSQQIGYVKWNFLENLWDVGYLDRTAWVNESPVGNPVGADLAGNLMMHEVSNDANGQPISWSFETGFQAMDQGDKYSFIDFVQPDFLGNYSQINMTINAKDNPNDPPRTYGPYVLTPTTKYVNTRVRGRLFQFQFSGNDLGSFVRLGLIRVRAAPSGRR
jgi:hypothetical protein